MKISYVTTYNAQDIHNWSGLGYSISKALENQKAQIDYIGNLIIRKKPIIRIKHKFISTILKKDLLISRDPDVAKQYANQIKLLLNKNTDIIFSPGTIPISLLDSDKPKIVYTDSTFAGMLNFYKEFSNLCNETIRDGNFLEKEALESSSLIIYASDWAAKSAIENYKIDKEKVKVVPFGAITDFDGDYETIKQIIRHRSGKDCNLLFVGNDWVRKGGELAVLIAKSLNGKGLKTTLHLVGNYKLPFKDFPSYIINHGYISKSTNEGREKIGELFKNSHFLLVPSSAEAYGLVFCEANAYGVPSISTNIGGIPTIIKNGVNGQMFNINSDVELWSDYILSTYNDRRKYVDLCLSSYNEYKLRLNWWVAGKSIMSLLKEI